MYKCGYIYRDYAQSHGFPYTWIEYNDFNFDVDARLFEVLENEPNKKHWHKIIRSLLEE